tara:strand:- start:2539 stop:4593 length:2055 start_codon:yes stop_codon:yes gene_type:complete
MAYRTQSTRSQYRDVSPSEEDNSYARDITAAATAFLGGELISLGKRNSERKQINNALMLQSEANRVRLMTDVGKLATLENEVNRDELKIAGSTVVKDFSDAQLRVNRSTGTYIYKDPLTGQEITREDDLKTIDQSNDWLSNIGGDIEASETLIAGIQDLYQAGKIGNKPGDLDIGATDPRALAVAIGEGVTEKYKVKKNKDGLYETTVEYSGKAIAEANKAEGVSGDTWTIDTKSLAEALNNPSRNPKNMLAYVASNDYTQNGGLFDSEKNAITNEGTLKPEFFENMGETTISVGGNKRQKVSQDRLKINEVQSAVYASSSAAAGSTMRGNNPQQVITDIKSYTRYDKEKNEYYYNTPLLSTTKDPETGEEITEGYLQYDDKGAVIMNKERTVVMKDNQLMIDQENLKPELTEMYSQYQLGNLGAYDNRRNTPIGNAYTKDESEPGDEVDTSLFNILSTSADDDKETLMLGGEDKVLEVKNIPLNDENFTGIGRDAEGFYVKGSDGKKDRSEKKYNFYKNAIIESVDKNEKPSLLARFDELEKMTPSGSVSIEKAVKNIVDKAKTDEYQKEEGLTGMLGAKYDDEENFAKYLRDTLGLESIVEADLRDVDFDDEEEMRTYITNKFFESDINKDVARKMSGKDVGSNQKETSTGQMTQTEWDATWKKLKKGESMVGLDGITYTKQ